MRSERPVLMLLTRVAVASGICAVLLFAALSSARAQSYLDQVGDTTYGTRLPVEQGYYDASTGDLHIEIPLGSWPQRGSHTFTAALVYDSRIWTINNNAWTPTNIPNSWAGWRLVTSPALGGSTTYKTTTGTCECPEPPCHRTEYYHVYSNFTWTDPSGTVHTFNLGTANDPWGCWGDEPTASGYAEDSTGYYMTVTNYTTISSITTPDGTQVYPGFKDTNGNYFSTDSSGNIIDTLGRKPVTTTANCNGNSNQICFNVLNAEGSTSTYTITTENISIASAFHQSGVSEWSGQDTIWAIIQLPDGSSYQFTYDNGGSGTYGELTSMLLPSNTETVSYTYTTYFDAFGNANRWLHTRTSSRTWTYAPMVSGCGGGYSYCQQVTVTKPSGDTTQYFFGSNLGSNGSWIGDITYNTGASTPIEYVSATWTSTLNNVQLQSVTTQPWDSGKALTSYVKYDYGNIFLQLVSKKSEWNYYVGTPPTSPDRVTNITYYMGRPATTTVTNGAGTQTFAQTNITYDSYGQSGLTSVTGTVQHDDNYGVGFTSRGNPTEVQRCVAFSGSTCSSWIPTSTTYDTTGRVTSVTDSANNTTTLRHSDCFYNDNNANPPATYTPPAPTNAYLTGVTLPIIGAQTTCYYYGTGQPAVATDQNNQTTYHHYYDAYFSRPTETVLPDGGWTLFSYPSQVETDSYIGIGSTTPSSSCTSCRHDQTVLDYLLRPHYHYLVNDPDPNGETITATTYDQNSRVATVTYPYRGSSNGQDSYTYDGLDRVTTVTHADNTAAKTYFGSGVTTGGGITTQICSTSTYGYGYESLSVDEAGKKREVWTDGFGRMIEVDEPDSSGSLTNATCYAHDLNDNLTSVGSATGQTRSYSYDALSRVTSTGAPETNVGGTQYYVTFAYMENGNACSGNPSLVCQRTDARGVTTTYGYDALNRLNQIAYSDGTPTVKYCYDGSNSSCISGGYSSSDGAGHRTAMSDGSGATGWSYSPTGRITSEQRTIAGITKAISYSYNLDGSLSSVTYPSGRTVNYNVGNAERALSATDSSGSPQYAASATYAPSGVISSVINGAATGFNGITESRGYNNRLETISIQASSSNGTAMNLAYCFNAFSFSNGCSSSATNNNGSVTGMTNNLYNGEGQIFAYDNLNRTLTAATQGTSGSDCWGQSFSIDSVANLTGITSTQCSSGQLSASTDGENHLTDQSYYSYDYDGNMTADSNYTYGFDAENRMKSASGMSGGPYCYIYDGDGRRIEKGDGGSCPNPTTVAVLYWRSITGDVLAETDASGNTINEYVFFAGRRIAQRNSGGTVYYYYSDRLGTTHAVTDATGHLCYDASFTPYGQEVDNPNVSQTCASNYRFAGYEWDSETDLYYAIARHYSWRLGRFMNADPLGGSNSTPQSLNRYAYVVNDTENRIDPTGLRYACLARVRRQDAGGCDYGSIDEDAAGGDFSGDTFDQEVLLGNGGGDLYGYTLFDAIEGAPGTYVTWAPGQIGFGFGFSYDLYSTTRNFIDAENAPGAQNVNGAGCLSAPPPSAGGADIQGACGHVTFPTTSGYQVYVENLGAGITTTSGFIPEVAAAYNEMARYYHSAYGDYFFALGTVGRMGIDPNQIYHDIIEGDPNPQVAGDFSHFMAAYQDLLSVYARYLPGLVAGQ